jgi:hypothetical protein
MTVSSAYVMWQAGGEQSMSQAQDVGRGHLDHLTFQQTHTISYAVARRRIHHRPLPFQFPWK